MKRPFLLIVALCCLSLPGLSQGRSIEDFTSGMEYSNGYFPFYRDEEKGKIWLEISHFDSEFLYVSSITAGLGSNDVGLDRNRLGATRVLRFKKAGPKVLMIESNYSFRAESDNPDEIKAVEDAFAVSVVWGFTVEAQSGERVLVDATPFLLQDANNIAGTLRRSGQGEYRPDMSRSAIYTENTRNFPLNSEFEALITFTSDSPGEYVRSVSPDGTSVTLRQHHSFVQLPDNNYEPRRWDPRSSIGAMSYLDYAVPVDQPIQKQFVRRHRLEKKDPSANISEPVEPIIYYVDRGTPEPIRSALIEGASWWNQAFEEAGYRNAFQVKVLPEGADPMDLRYNMINWIHRSTRGWSYGATVTDPRTGEIIKGHVALGSLRIRQDFLIASGLIAEYEEGKELDPQIMETALLRIKQLSCHEVGHTLGLNHNYAASVNNRASVMDYPHPLVKINNGQLDLSDAYPAGIGEWDKVSIEYGYQDFPASLNENDELDRILNDAFSRGLLFLSDQDSRGTHPLTHVWDNGTDPADELERVMKIREIALDNFSERKIPEGAPLSTLEEILVPVYLFHRYQITATASMIGGLYYNHNVRGGSQPLPEFVPKKEQLRALDMLIKVISPENLILDEELLGIIPPRTPGYRQNQELFPGYTGLIFDPIAAAENVASLAVEGILDPERAARIVLFSSRDKDQPPLEEIIDSLLKSTWYTPKQKDHEAEIQRSVNNIVLNNLILLAANKNNASQVRAVANLKIRQLQSWLKEKILGEKNEALLAHWLYAIDQIQFYRDNPDRIEIPGSLPIPAGAPIGMYNEY